VISSVDPSNRFCLATRLGISYGHNEQKHDEMLYLIAFLNVWALLQFAPIKIISGLKSSMYFLMI